MTYKIRYADNSLYTGDWASAPGYGVQTIVYPDGDTIVLRHQGDFYRVDDDGCVVGMDLVSLLHYVIDDLNLVKAGSMVSRTKYVDIMAGARADQKNMRESG